MPKLMLLGIKPDLLLVTVVAINLVGRSKYGLVLGLLGGLLLDLTSVGPFGLLGVALTIAVLVTRVGQRNVFGLGLTLPLVIAVVSTVLYYMLIFLGTRLSGEIVDWGDAFLRVLSPAVLINSGFMILTYNLVVLVRKRFGPEEMNW